MRERVTRRAGTPAPEPARALPRSIPAAVRVPMESAFGADLSQVRVHPDSTFAAGLGATAFTHGDDIHVAPGWWRPHTSAGRELLGHELAHVLQQRAGAVAPTTRVRGTAVNDDPALERAADAVGARAARGEAAPMRPGPPAGRPGVVQRQAPLGPVLSTPADEVEQALAPPVVGAAPDYEQAFRVLGGLSTAELMTVLAELAARRRLGPLIANIAAVPPPLDPAVLTVALRVVRQSTGPPADLAAAHATLAAAHLPPSVHAVMHAHLLALRPAVPRTRGADQRVSGGRAAREPDAALAREIGFELDPGSRPAPAPPPPPRARGAPPPPPPPPPARVPWDGVGGTPAALAARATMKAELFRAYDAYLTFTRADVTATLGRPTVSFPAGGGGGSTGVVDIANEARGVLEARYGVTMDAASSTPAQVADRAPRVGSGPGQNIFDATSEADRSTMTSSPDLAPGVAHWLFDNDVPGASGAAGSRTFATDVTAAHRYAAQDDPNDAFRWEVAHDYAAASTLPGGNRRQLIDYRMAGWGGEQGDRGITLSGRFDPGGDPGRAELQQRWEIFRAGTHESLHLRAHPAFVAAEQGRDTMREGFVEMFTIATLNTDVMPGVRAGRREPLRRTVEGARSPARPDPALATNRTTPTQYLDHRAQAERIRDGGRPSGGAAHAGIGEAGVRAAFFQGHVEFLGLDPAGAQLPGLRPAGARARVRIPPGTTGIADLAVRSGVPAATIRRDNPGITDALPADAVLAGTRQHRVLAGETRAKIAAQHGVSEADLVRANPDIPTDLVTNAWPALPAGRTVLVPVH